MYRIAALCVVLAVGAGCRSKEADRAEPPSPVPVSPPRTAGALEVTLSVPDAEQAAEALEERFRRYAEAGLLPHAEVTLEPSGNTIRVSLGLSEEECRSDDRAQWLDRLRQVVAPPGTLALQAAVGGTHPEVARALREVAGVTDTRPTWRDGGGLAIRGGAPGAVEQALEDLPVQPGQIALLAEDPVDADVDHEVWVAEATTPITGEDIASVGLTEGPTGEPQVVLTFDDDAKERFHELSARLVDEVLLVVVNGRVSSAPWVREPIPGGRAHITLGAASPGEMTHQAHVLIAALSAPLPGVQVQSESVRCPEP